MLVAACFPFLIAAVIVAMPSLAPAASPVKYYHRILLNPSCVGEKDKAE